MKFNLNHSNWFSRVLVGTAVLATLGIMVPEVVQGNSIESQDTLTVSAGNKQTATTVYNTGQEAMRSQNYQQAIANFDQAIAANPKHAEAYRDRGIAHHNLGDYASAKADLHKSASLFLQEENNLDLHKTLLLISRVDKTFQCRQSNDQWETVMNRDSQTYPLIIWHDQRVMDIDTNGQPKYLAEVESEFAQQDRDQLGQIPHFEQSTVVNMITLSNENVTTTITTNPSNAKERCFVASERLNNLDNLIFKQGAQNLFIVGTLSTVYPATNPVTGSTVTLRNDIQAACIDKFSTGCDDTNAIFTLSGQSEKSAKEQKLTLNETNEQRLARFVRLIDNPRSDAAPIHN